VLSMQNGEYKVEEYLSEMRHLKDKEAKQLLRDFAQLHPSSAQLFGSGKDVGEQVVDENTVFFVNGRPLILRTKFGLLPSLVFDEFIKSLPKVVVDMGAVAHVANGANIMRPGIKEIPNDFAKGDLLLIVDEKFGKNIALGQADMDSAAMKSMNKGKVIVNIHYVGDELWKAMSASKSP
jgi:PUA-domain protein